MKVSLFIEVIHKVIEVIEKRGILIALRLFLKFLNRNSSKVLFML